MSSNSPSTSPVARKRSPQTTPKTTPQKPTSRVAHLRPSKAYIAQTAQAHRQLTPEEQKNRPKLLVLDLNNNLVARKNRTPAAGRNCTPRPYLSTFLRYAHKSNWSLMIFSSAMPENVDAMARAIGLTDEGVLLALWNREKLGLKPEEMRNKVETVKDLSAVWKEVKLGEHQFSQVDTVLIDDSDGKARLQPFNHLFLPPFDPFNSASMREPYEPLYPSPTRRKPTSKPSETTPTQDGPRSDASEDSYLLRAIAGLEILSTMSDMSAAMRAGVLHGLAEVEDAGHSSDDDLSSKLAQLSVKKKEGPWERRGREACDRVGISVTSAFDPQWAR